MSLSRLIVCILLASPITQAAPTKAVYLDPALERGMGTTEYASPNNYIEKCILSSDLPFNSGEGRKLDDEQKLCGIDMHQNAGIGVCPKYGSTNPALEVYRLDANDKTSFETNVCTNSAIDPEPKKLAKFKSSVSCSYAPGIVAYYHMARLFNGPAVPPSVIRTYDKEIHFNKRATAITALVNNPKKKGTLINKTWDGEWNKAYGRPASDEAKRVFTADLKGVYGVLSANPSNEEYYREVNGSIKSYETRFDGFTATPTYQRIIDPRSAAQLLTRDFTHAAQPIQQMRDVSTMLILDYILSQADRPGNIAYKLYYWKLAADGSVLRQKDNAPGFIPIKEMLMKDNDCSVIKTNNTKDRNLLSMLSHIHPDAYKGLQRLAHEFQTNTNQMGEFLKREWMFADDDVVKVKNNAIALAAHLKARCRAGSLHQDLDLKEFLAGNATHSCE